MLLGRFNRQSGFILPLTILLILGISAIMVGTLFNGRMGRMSAFNYEGQLRAFMAAEGMVTLLSQEVLNGRAQKYLDTSRVGSIRGAVWYGLPGTSVSQFIWKTKSTPPSDSLTTPHLGSNIGKMHYGVKWTGWIILPLTGAYTFITRSDDESRFYLSTDAEPSNLSGAPICKIEPGWVDKWPTTGQAVSAPVLLTAGHRYYFEYYHKQGDGWDVGQVGWNGPEFFMERPISGQYLSRFKSDPQWDGTRKEGGGCPSVSA